MRVKIYCFLICFVVATTTQGQSVPGELIAQLSRAQALCKSTFPSGFTFKKTLSHRTSIHLLAYDTLRYSLTEAIQQLSKHPEVALVQPNHRLQTRDTLPADPFFPEQWQWQNLSTQNSLPDADVDAELAWSLPSYGPATAFGDTIVIAMLDDGIQANHPDLAANLWRNHGEIPNNHIDDDQNGYVDDYRGWNPVLESDHIHQGHHGTPVAGMIGAAWQNGKGGTGIAPQIKIMVIAGSSQTEAGAIAAYAYVLEQRLRYNETQGEAGAFVVATNASWGVNGLSPEDAPVWCQLYDDLGEAGILNCAATSNSSWNIDEVGDMPTACNSPYLITVTASDRMDECTGAFGPVSVDLAAPGKEIFTTHPGGNYGWSSGTSFASPIAAGTIGLLYGANCPDLSSLAHTNPGAAALEAKSILLNTTDALPSMIGQTVTGGRLNTFRALEELALNCLPCSPVYNLNLTALGAQEALAQWTTADSSLAVTIYWRPSGSAEWESVPYVSSPFLLSGLDTCTQYEVKLIRQCADNLTSESPVAEVRTKGCCLPPSQITATSVTNTSAMLSWEASENDAVYQIQVQNDSGWIFSTTNSGTSIQLSGLSPCTVYEAYMSAVCAEDSNSFSSLRFITAGCGSCTDFEYCTSYGGTSGTEWIDAVTFGEQYHHSGLHEGNPLFPGAGFSVSRGQMIPVSVRPGFQHIAYPEYIRIWIDLNQDGLFAPVAELLLDTMLLPDQDSLLTQLLLPADALPGTTRMRVSLKWAGFGSMRPQPCEPHIHFGEVEDYCVDIQEPPLTSSTDAAEEAGKALQVWPNPFGNALQLKIPADAPEAEVQLIGVDGRLLLQRTLRLRSGQPASLPIPYTLPPGWYLLRAKVGSEVLQEPVLHHSTE